MPGPLNLVLWSGRCPRSSSSSSRAQPHPGPSPAPARSSSGCCERPLRPRPTRSPLCECPAPWSCLATRWFLGKGRKRRPPRRPRLQIRPHLVLTLPPLPSGSLPPLLRQRTRVLASPGTLASRAQSSTRALDIWTQDAGPAGRFGPACGSARTESGAQCERRGRPVSPAWRFLRPGCPGLRSSFSAC